MTSRLRGREGDVATLERFGPTGRDPVVLDEARRALSVGKSADNDLVIDDDPAVSRVHARLEHLGPAWCITDLGSTNGTTVNGERVFAPRTLFDRDEILVGRTRLVLRVVGARGDVTTADALYVTESAVKQHLDRLYKFGIGSDTGGSRRVLLANEAIQTAAVTMRDLQPTASDGR